MILHPTDQWCNNCSSYSKKTVHIHFDGKETIIKELNCRYCGTTSYNKYALELTAMNCNSPSKEFRIMKAKKPTVPK